MKPENILLYKDNRARLTDFGIVKDISSLKGYLVKGRAVGTAAYASPEQCLGKRLSAATDMYSLGATLFTVVCGRHPFVADSRSAIMKKHVQEKDSICAECHDPDDRGWQEPSCQSAQAQVRALLARPSAEPCDE